MNKKFLVFWALLGLVFHFPSFLHAEEEYEEGSAYEEESTDPYQSPAEPRLSPRTRQKGKRKFFVEDIQRSDAGIFHVGFAGGGNLYIEPKIDRNSMLATGDYFKDFGFQAGIYFDYDYSRTTQNIPLGLRGMVGYRYILTSVHEFVIDAMARYMILVNNKTTFGLGVGIEGGLWYRALTSTSPTEQWIFLPAFLVGAGFEFEPFMAEVKWAIQRLGSDNALMGWELSFGFHI